MADQDPHSEEHIEDLLSQLQGIFGKISQSEDEESKEKVVLPPAEPPPVSSPPPQPSAAHTNGQPPQVSEPAPTPAAPPPEPEPAPMQAAPLSEPEPAPPPSAPEPVLPVLEPVAPAAPEPVLAPAIVSVAPAPLETPPPPVDATTPMPIEGDNAVVGTVIYFPAGRQSEAQMLSNKLETMTPKFTRVAFQLKVASSTPYDPKSDPRQTILQQALQQNVRAVFWIVDRPLDEARKKSVAAELEPRGVYFQDVPLGSIERKAFYTDLLLGLVFFFDSLKSSSGQGDQ